MPARPPTTVDKSVTRKCTYLATNFESKSTNLGPKSNTQQNFKPSGWRQTLRRARSNQSTTTVPENPQFLASPFDDVERSRRDTFTVSLLRS